jgi:tRNA pseudouridine38-40 synthase
VDFIYRKPLVIFEITANRFLRNMVRAITGTLAEVGLGKISVAEFERIIQSQSRAQASSSAPAHALFLTDVKYPESIFTDE